jgi:hypothetical protein
MSCVSLAYDGTIDLNLFHLRILAKPDEKIYYEAPCSVVFFIPVLLNILYSIMLPYALSISPSFRVTE